MSRELDEWRRRTAAAGLDVQKVESAARKKRGLAPLPASEYATFTTQTGDGTAPRARRGDQAARPDRASREGVTSKTGELWDRLRSIAESDMDDDEKRQLYETAGVDENRVRDVLAQIEAGEAAEAVDAPVVPDDGIAAMLERKFGPPQNEAQRAYIESFRQQDIAEAAAEQERQNAERVARLAEQQAEFEREEPWWMTTLKVLDKPRAVVVAGFSQLGAALDGDDTTVASWDRFADQVGDNVTVTSLIDEDMMPGWARFALGFGVDVLLDPLTYLTGGSAAVAKVAGKGGIKLAGLVDDAASEATRLAKAADAAGDAATFAARTTEADGYMRLIGRIGEGGGYAGLSKADRELAEQALRLTGNLKDGQTLRGGVYFRLPGTEGVRLPGLSEALTPVSRAASRGSVNLRKTKFWSAVSHPFSTKKREFLQEFKLGATLNDKIAGLKSYRAATSSQMGRARYVEALQANRVALLARGKKLGVASSDLHHYLGSPTGLRPDGTVNPIAERIAAEGRDGPVGALVQDWVSWWSRSRTMFNDAVGPENAIGEVDNYTFHLRLQAAEDGENAFDAAVRGLPGSSGNTPVAPEFRRKVQQGRVFQGVEIVDPSETGRVFGPGFEGLSPEQQAREILRRQGREVEGDILFSDDLESYSELYVNMMGNRLERLSFGRVLREQGAAMSTEQYRLLGRQEAGNLTDRYRLVMRTRFGAQTADIRDRVAREAQEFGVAPPRSLVADLGDLVDGLKRTAFEGGGTVDDVRRGLDEFRGVTRGVESRVDELADGSLRDWSNIQREMERSFRELDAEEMFDLYSTGISNRTAPLMQSLEGKVGELAVVAAGLDSRVLFDVGNNISEARTALMGQLAEKQAILDVAAGRNRADEAVALLTVEKDVARIVEQIQVLDDLAGEVDRVRAVIGRVERAVSGDYDGLVSVARALLPGSDGVARLGNGEVARFTRVNGDVGGGVVDRIGVRFTLADDADAADARFMGDMVAQNPEARIIPPDAPIEAKNAAAPTISREMNEVAESIWDSPTFADDYAELLEDYKDALEVREFLRQADDTTVEGLRRTGRNILVELDQRMDVLRQRTEALGGSWVQGGPRFPLDTSLDRYYKIDEIGRPIGFAEPAPKGKIGGGRKIDARGRGEIDWLTEMGADERREFALRYTMSRTDAQGRVLRKRSVEDMAAEVQEFEGVNREFAMDIDDFTDEMFSIIREYEQVAGDLTALRNALRVPQRRKITPKRIRNEQTGLFDGPEPEPRKMTDGEYAAIVEERAEVLREMANRYGGSEYAEMLAYSQRFYSPSEFEQIFTRINQLGASEVGPPPRQLFRFTTSSSRPLTFTGQTAGTQLNADLLLHGIRTNQINLRPVSVTPENVGNIGDILLWNRMVGIVGDASRSRSTTPSMLVDLLNRTIRDYAGFDPQSFAARVVASTDNPADMLLDGVLNRAAMSSTDRAQLGVWDDLLDGVTVNGDKLGRSYANDLGRRGFDAAMLDDGSTRQIVSFRPDSMLPENPQSRALLRLLDQQTALRKRVVGLRDKLDKTVARFGFDPDLMHTNPESMLAARLKSQKRLDKLSRTRNRTAVQETEYLLRRDAKQGFDEADDLSRQADELKAAFDAEYRQGVRQAEKAGLLPAEQGPDPVRIKELRDEATAVRLLAQADTAEADLVRSGVDAGYDMLFTGNLASNEELAAGLAAMLRQGMVALNDTTMAPELIAKISADAARAVQTVEARKLLRAFDYVTGVFKSYAVMSPGFINRNVLGAVGNNWLGLVNLKSYPEFFKADSIFSKAIKSGDNIEQALAKVQAKFGDKGRRAFETWLEIAPGTSGGMASSWASDVGVAAANAVSGQGLGAAVVGRGLTSQGLRDNSLTRGFFYVNTKAEYKVRGVMAWDEIMRKNGDMQSAVDRVFQYHFDYSPQGMSSFERNVLRRGIPFYVWMANNIPLQLKGLVTRPKVAASYWKFKQNMEELSEDEGIVPEYFGRLGAVRLPFTNSDGNSFYFMPDLPFRDLGMFKSIKPTVNPIDFVANLVDMNEIQASVNPIIRTPVETLLMDKKAFTGAPFRDGYVPMGLLGRVPGLPQALGALGQAKRGPDGEWMVRERELYAVEQFQPLIGRISRLFPQDEKGREKQWTAWLSTFLGVGFRTNTWTEQSNQLFKLQDQLDTAIRSAETLGRSVPTKTEIQRANETERQVAMLGGYSAETDFLLRIINSGDTRALADLDGFGDESAAKTAQSVAQSGAFTDAADLVTAKDVSVSGVERAVLSLRERSQFTLDPATASQVELEAMPNVGPKTAAKIVALRDRGGLVSLDSLRQVGLSRRQIQEIAEWLDSERQFQAQMAGVL